MGLRAEGFEGFRAWDLWFGFSFFLGLGLRVEGYVYTYIYILIMYIYVYLYHISIYIYTHVYVFFVLLILRPLSIQSLKHFCGISSGQIQYSFFSLVRSNTHLGAKQKSQEILVYSKQKVEQ